MPTQPSPTVSSIPLPALSPASTANYYAQLATLQSGLNVALAAKRAQRVGIKADARVARADAKAAAIDAMGSTVNDAIERNSVGASYDLAARVGVRADLANTKAQAANDARMALAQNRIEEQGTALEYQLAGQQLEGQRIAEIQGALADQLLNNTLMSGMEAQTDALRAVFEQLANPPTPHNPGRRGDRPGQTGVSTLPDVIGAGLDALGQVGTALQLYPTPGLVNGMNPQANGRRR